jgi:hypothetical protein
MRSTLSVCNTIRMFCLLFLLAVIGIAALVGYIKAVIRKRTDETHNFGFPEWTPVPTELYQHPFWDLRAVICNNYWSCPDALGDAVTADGEVPKKSKTSELCGWIFKRGYAIPVEQMNAWKLRYFKLVEKENGAFVLEYFSKMPKHDNDKHHLKGTIDLHDIVFFDFSPKTTVVYDTSLTHRVVETNMDIQKMTVFKLIMGNGRRFALGCNENQALNWIAELIRFGSMYKAEADWRRNWGSYRHTRICLRDWINASSVS